MIENFNKLILYRRKLIRPHIDNLLLFSNAISYVVSLLMILAVVFDYGFIISVKDQLFVSNLYTLVWGVFFVDTSLQLLFNFNEVRSKSQMVKWGLSLLLYISLIPRLFSQPEAGSLFYYPWMVLDSTLFNIVLLFALSLLQLSSGIILLMKKSVNPSFIFSISFFVFILIGTGLLMLPRSTYEGISFIDALFTATSAICVTGLSTVDMATTFSPMGQLFILLLIQVGGLGVMTLTSFFALFFMGSATSLNNQVLMCDMVSSKSMSTLIKTLIYILGFTLLIELVGAILIFISLQGTFGMSLQQEIWFAVFHSISAFCNAGFSTLSDGLGNEVLMKGHNGLYLIISFLIILGGLGFPILVNLFESTKYRVRSAVEALRSRSLKVQKRVHLNDLNTRIVLRMTGILLVVGTILLALLEWNNAFEGMGVWDKFVQSFFNAVSPRTAGFNSVGVGAFSLQSLLLIFVLMVIGGGTQSTAGGLKVNVFAVVLLNLRAILFGQDRVTAFNRQISDKSIRSSNSALILYFIFAFVGFFTLTILEPEAPVRALLFETISALSTVGSTLDLTPSLGGDSKFVIIVLMFVGRVGVLAMMSSIIKQKKNLKLKYPNDNIIIN